MLINNKEESLIGRINYKLSALSLPQQDYWSQNLFTSSFSNKQLLFEKMTILFMPTLFVNRHYKMPNVPIRLNPGGLYKVFQLYFHWFVYRVLFLLSYHFDYLKNTEPFMKNGFKRPVYFHVLISRTSVTRLVWCLVSFQ